MTRYYFPRRLILFAVVLLLTSCGTIVGLVDGDSDDFDAVEGRSCVDDGPEVPEAECIALVMLFTGTSGENWTNRTGWGQNSRICSWHGVRCSNGQVDSLGLVSNGLTGSLPPELSALGALKVLALGDNRLTGEIPAELGYLPRLSRLTLRDNLLTGSIPPELGNLLNLGVLGLHNNQLTGMIPPELGSLRLFFLNLSGNQLGGSIPSELGNLSGLNYLLLHDNQLAGAVPLPVADLGAQVQSSTDPDQCRLDGNPELFIPGNRGYRDADRDGDNVICGVALDPPVVLSPPDLISPDGGAIIPQNQQASGCLPSPTAGSGYSILFDWSDVPVAGGSPQYRIALERQGATAPTGKEEVIAVSEFGYVNCGFVPDSDLAGWEWKVRTEHEGEFSEWSDVRSFEFAPCLLEDGGPCRLSVLFDNGSSSGVAPANSGSQRLFEDFVLAESSRVTGITWQQHDHPQATYVGTEILVFAALPYEDSPVFSQTVVAERTRNVTETVFDFEGYDYQVTGLSIDLPPGTYWLGLNSPGAFTGGTAWDLAAGGPDAIPGYRLVNPNFPAPGQLTNGHLAFTLIGDASGSGQFPQP